MRPLSDMAGQPLYWVQPHALRRRFELRDPDGDLVATLRFERTLGTLATAESAAGTWTFKRTGFLNPQVTVRHAGLEANLAVYQPRFWGGGRLSLADGRAYDWEAFNLWRTQWGFVAPGGQRLFVLRPGSETSQLTDLFKKQAIVEFESPGEAADLLLLMICLGWYLLVMYYEDSAATSAAVTAATAG